MYDRRCCAVSDTREIALKSAVCPYIYTPFTATDVAVTALTMSRWLNVPLVQNSRKSTYSVVHWREPSTGLLYPNSLWDDQFVCENITVLVVAYFIDL